jgi:hypothetical protein
MAQWIQVKRAGVPATASHRHATAAPVRGHRHGSPVSPPVVAPTIPAGAYTLDNLTPLTLDDGSYLT